MPDTGSYHRVEFLGQIPFPSTTPFLDPLMWPRPIHRTKTFWLGLFVLLFLAWAFVRSIGHRDSVGYGFNTSRWFFEAGSRAGSFTWQSGKTPPDFGRRSGWFSESETRSEGISFREPFEMITGDGPLWIEIDYWLLALLFLMPWTTFLVRRSRFMKLQTDLTQSAGHRPA